MTTPEVEPRLADAAEAARLQAEEVERLTLLVEASSTLLGSLHLEDVLPKVLELARRILAADAHALWRFDREREEWSVQSVAGLSEEYQRAASAAIVGNNATVSLEEPIVAEDIESAEWLTPAHREAHRVEGNRAMMAIPLRRLDEVLGTLAFYYRRPHTFTASERSAASTLANLAASAIATAELYAAQARTGEERAFLAEASAHLASSRDVESTLPGVAELAVPRFADWCAIDLLRPDGSLERLVLVHADPAKGALAAELEKRYPPDPNAPHGPARVIRTREPELVPVVTDEIHQAMSRDNPERLRVIRELGFRSGMCVPLLARGEVLGTLTFVTGESGRRYDEGDLATAQDLARRIAAAVENALLFRDAEAARSAAQESLGLLDSIYATAPVGLAFMDRDLRYVRINDALAAMNGGSASDFVGKRLEEVLGDVYPEVEPLHREVLETGRPRLGVLVTGALPAAPDEQKAWLSSYYPVRDAKGDVTGVGVAILDVTERERVRAEAEAARERLSVLAEASTLLASSLDYETTLANIATLLVPRYADWYAVDVVDESGSFRRLAVVHRDPAKREWAERARRDYTAEPGEPEGTGRVVRTGESLLYRRIDDDLLRSSTVDEEHYEVLRALGMESAMVVPLTAGGRTFGALLLVSSDPAHRYDEEDLDFAGHLGRRAAVAVDNALLYGRSERAEGRQRFLAEASALLASSLDYGATLERVAALTVPSLADLCVVDLLQDGTLERVAAAHADPAVVEQAFDMQRRWPTAPDDEAGPGAVVRTGRSETGVVSERLLAAAAKDEEQLRVLRALQMHAFVCVPIETRGRVLGSILLVSTDPARRYDHEDMELAEELARRAAVAVDNARLYEAAEARARAALVVEYVADGVMLVDRTGRIRLWNPAAAATTGVAEDEVLGRPVTEVLHGWERLPAPARAGADEATTPQLEILPVELGGRELWLSVSGVDFGEGCVYAFRDLTAERAVEQLKTDFVATVSHELRTPLAAIYGAALTLRRSDVPLPEPQRAGLLEVIASESDRLARIVNDILWASRLESGVMQTTIESCDPAKLAGGIVEAARSYVPPNVTLQFDAEDALPLVSADPDKLRQVLTNLVDNAVKYSPDGGLISVSVQRAGGRVRFVVADQGLGIPPTEQQRIFEKFYRLDPNLTRGVGGTGLGLYISRELILRMGGRIWVESRGAGAGSTFVVELGTAG